MQRPDDSSLTPGQLARVRKEAERALRESGALGVFPTPVDQIMAVARVAEVKEDVWPAAGFVDTDNKVLSEPGGGLWRGGYLLGSLRSRPFD
jgi:hypothetical protein